MDKGEIFFLALSDGRPVGFTSVDFEIRANLHFMSVLKDEQGKGIATLLLKTVIDEVLKRNYNYIITFTEKDGTNLNNFLKKRGFEEVGFHKDRYGKGKDAIIFNLNLKS
jgi:GNAT superfamily N-acetyltransferase